MSTTCETQNSHPGASGGQDASDGILELREQATQFRFLNQSAGVAQPNPRKVGGGVNVSC